MAAIKGLLDRVINRFGPNGFRIVKVALEYYKQNQAADKLTTFVKDLGHLKELIRSELDQEVIVEMSRFLDTKDQEKYEQMVSKSMFADQTSKKTIA